MAEANDGSRASAANEGQVADPAALSLAGEAKTQFARAAQLALTAAEKAELAGVR